MLAGTADVARTGLDLPQLSRLLHLSAGVVRTIEGDHQAFRAGRALDELTILVLRRGR